jgi:hypothetical protein
MMKDPSHSEEKPERSQDHADELTRPSGQDRQEAYRQTRDQAASGQEIRTGRPGCAAERTKSGNTRDDRSALPSTGGAEPLGTLSGRKQKYRTRADRRTDRI